MIRVVADTNIYISALQFGGRPAAFLDLARQRRWVLVASGPILDEVENVLVRKFAWKWDRVATERAGLTGIAELVAPVLEIAECEDPDDNRILEAAVEGSADFIVTGDQHLLRMNPFRRIEIVTVAAFLRANIG